METGSVVCEFAFVFLYSENPKAEKQDTFVEKLVTQVIKNLQVKISNIHVRYEDDVSTSAWSFYILKPTIYCIILCFITEWYDCVYYQCYPCVQVTNPNAPLSFGVSLQNLSLQVCQ